MPNTKQKSLLKFAFSLLGVIAIVSSIFGGYTYFDNLINKDLDLAQAALNCPAGSTLTGGQCISTTPSGYTCPAGQTVSGTNCVTLSCPNGGVISGNSCIPNSFNGIDINLAGTSICPTTDYARINFTFADCWRFNPSLSIPASTCTPVGPSNACQLNNPGYDPNQGIIDSGVCNFSQRKLTFPDGFSVCGTGPLKYLGNNGCLLGVNPSQCSPLINTYGEYVIIYYSQILADPSGRASYAANITSSTPATPQFNTVVNASSYTPESGQISNFTCTPSTITAGESVTCSGQATGAPSGVSYSGNITVTIDNGGGTATVPLTSTGSFTTPVTVGTTTGTKTATTNIGGSSSISVTSASTPLNPGDIPGLTVVCDSAPVNGLTTCRFTLPSNKTLPSNFNFKIGDTDNAGPTPAVAQTCTITNTTTSEVTCTNVPTGNSIGNIPIYARFEFSPTATKTATGENVTITGVNFAKVDWTFNPTQGNNAPLFRDNGNTTITINNLKTIFDSTPTSNTRYTCNIQYRSLNDRNTASPTWNNISATPIAYTTGTGANAGCTFNLTKQQRGNILNYGLRLTITDTELIDLPVCNPGESCILGGPNIQYTLYNEYIYRFQGAGVASGG